MLNEVIQKKINELPSNIRRAVEKFDWATEIMHIAKENKMQIDDIDTFKKETLLVIVGLTSADDFERNLVKQLGIPHHFAEKLVNDANEYIFQPLQKIAFSRKDNESSLQTDQTENNVEKDIISHKEVNELMIDHGIELIDEEDEQDELQNKIGHIEKENPKNELQNLADSLFQEKKPTEAENKTPSFQHISESVSKITKKVIDNKIPDQAQNDKVISYSEPIREEDLEGIRGHRIDTSILKKRDDLQTSKNDPLNNTQKLDKDILNNIKISKEEEIDVSPSKEKQITERGDFLKHIGAS